MKNVWNSVLCVSLAFALLAIPVGQAVAARSVHRSSVSACDPATGSGSCGTGGAGIDTTPSQLTAAQQAAVASKMAAAQSFAGQSGSGVLSSKQRAKNRPDYQDGDWYYSDNYLLKPEPNYSNSYGNYPTAWGGG